MHQIDINCDMGEYDSAAECVADIAFMPYISQCNIAVGGHIGNEETIRSSFINAQAHDLMIGIHPSYPDRAGFGRQRYELGVPEIIDSLKAQIETGIRIASAVGVELHHIKCHGALYNDIETDDVLCSAIAKLFSDYALAVMGMAGGILAGHCHHHGLQFIHEAFMDRRYQSSCQLQPRSEAGAVITDMERVLDQALAIATHKPIEAVNGDELSIKADTLCVHSDTTGALNLVKAVRRQFALESVHVRD